MKRGPLKNIMPILAAVCIILAGVAFYTAFRAARDPEMVATAATNIPAYTLVSEEGIKWEEVPKGSVVEGRDITKDEYEKRFTKENPLITTLQVLEGARFDIRAVAKSTRESFSVVSPDERVVAVTSTLSGAAIGTINAGDVVDAQQGGSGSTDSAGTTFAKVICISASSSGCAGVLPAGVNLSVEGSGDNGTEQDNGAVNVLLAVRADDAGGIAGRQVDLALNPFCKFGSSDDNLTPDQFYSARTEASQKCQAPGDRLATTGGSTSTPSSDDPQATTPDSAAGTTPTNDGN